MADQISLLENIRDELKSNNKKAAEEAATAEKGILSQKQLLKVQQELKKSQEKDSKNLAAAYKIMMKSSSSEEGKDKAKEVIKRLEEKMADESQSVKNQESMMQKAAEVRGVSVETFKEMRGKLEQSDENLTVLRQQEEQNKDLGIKDYKLQNKIANEEKRKARREKKLEGGKLSRAKAQMKASLAQMTTLEGIKSGIAGIGKGLAGGLGKMGGKGMKGVKSMFGLIMKGAMLALLPAILLFFNSPLWDKTKTFLMETALPAVKRFYNEAIVPAFNFIKDEILPILLKFVSFLKDEILPIFINAFSKTWENIKELFGTLKESFDKIICGDIIGGIIGIIKGISTFILKQLDVALTAVFNIIASIFGLEKTDSVFGSIKGFFNDIYNKVKTFFSDMYTGFINFLKGPIAEFFEPLTCAIMDVWNAVKAIFSGEDIMKNLAKLAGALLDIVYAPVNLAINFIRKIFGFGGECGGDTEPFRISKFIGDILRKVIEFFRGIFDFDIKGAVKKLIPDVLFEAPVVGGLLKKVFGVGDDKTQEVEMESDSVTKAKIEEERKKGNIKSIGTVDPYGTGSSGSYDYLNRAALEKEVVAGNGGGTLITTNNVSTAKTVHAETNVSPVQDQDPVLKTLDGQFP